MQTFELPIKLGAARAGVKPRSPFEAQIWISERRRRQSYKPRLTAVPGSFLSFRHPGWLK